MEGFTSVNSRRRLAVKARKAAETARIESEKHIPGAVWADVPMNRSHLPGIPYSYYDDEIVMIRQRTAELIERQRAQAAQGYKRPSAGQWYRWEQGRAHTTHKTAVSASSEWQGVDE